MGIYIDHTKMDYIGFSLAVQTLKHKMKYTSFRKIYKVSDYMDMQKKHLKEYILLAQKEVAKQH